MSKKTKKQIGTSLNQKAAAKAPHQESPFVMMLEKALELAKSNQLTNLAVLGTTVNGKAVKSIIMGDPLSYVMLGALNSAKDSFSEALREEEKLQVQVQVRQQAQDAATKQQKANGGAPKPGRRPQPEAAPPS